MDVRVNGRDAVRLVPVLHVCGNILLVSTIGARFGGHSCGKHVECEELHSIF